VASATCTREPLPGRDPIREEVPWVDLTSAGQLDRPSSATRMRGDKKLGFGKENYGLKIKSKVFSVLTIGMPIIGRVPSYI
jgi:hypothetical protein